MSLVAANATAWHVERLWDAAAPFETAPSMRALGYPPHLTLAIYDAPEVASGTVRAATIHVAGLAASLHLSFARLSVFDGEPLVIWAAPEPEEDLRRLHRTLHAKIDPALCRPYYRPGQWIPHCTLATQVASERRAEALRFVSTFEGPVEVVFDRIEAVTFPPVEVIEARRLEPASLSAT